MLRQGREWVFSAAPFACHTRDDHQEGVSVPAPNLTFNRRRDRRCADCCGPMRWRLAGTRQAEIESRREGRAASDPEDGRP